MRTLLLVVVLGLAGCVTDRERQDAFVSQNAGFSTRGAGETLLLYLPNRIIDALDVVHFGVTFGLGIGLELQITRPVSFGLMASMDASVGWFGRFSEIGGPHVGPYARATAGVHQAVAAPNDRDDPAGPWQFPYWDIGVHRGMFILGISYVAFAPDELVDFLAGWLTIDTKRDDYVIDWDDDEPSAPPPPDWAPVLPDDQRWHAIERDGHIEYVPGPAPR